MVFPILEVADTSLRKAVSVPVKSGAFEAFSVEKVSLFQTFLSLRDTLPALVTGRARGLKSLDASSPL